MIIEQWVMSHNFRSYNVIYIDYVVRTKIIGHYSLLITHYLEYRVSKKKLTPFIFKLATNLLLAFVCSHVYSQHEVVYDCKSTVPFKFLQLKLIFNSHMGLDLCFEWINGSLIWYASFTNEIFGQLLSNYSRYAANLNMKAVRFFSLTLYKRPLVILPFLSVGPWQKALRVLVLFHVYRE